MPEILKSKISVFVDLYRNNALLLQQIKERVTAEEHLRASQQSLRALASRLQSVREEEWTRIAREIHDQLAQALTGLKMDLAWITSRLPEGSKALREKAHSMSGLIDATWSRCAKSCTSCGRSVGPARTRSSDRLAGGRVSTSQRHPLQRVASRGRLAAGQGSLTAMFRIFQELLTNVARHAGAPDRCGDPVRLPRDCAHRRG